MKYLTKGEGLVLSEKSKYTSVFFHSISGFWLYVPKFQFHDSPSELLSNFLSMVSSAYWTIVYFWQSVLAIQFKLFSKDWENNMIFYGFK